MSKDARLRIPVDREYVHSIDLAMIAFARLEWIVVWWCQKMKPGYINTVNGKTAGQIGKDFAAMVKKFQRVDLERFSAEYERMTLRRNDLVHANPGTYIDGRQLLFRHAAPWMPEAIDDLADEFAQLGAELAELFHASP